MTSTMTDVERPFVACATDSERERIRTIFTLDRRDFATYRPAKLGRFSLIP